MRDPHNQATLAGSEALPASQTADGPPSDGSFHAQIVRGSRPHYSSETQSLLQSRLRSASLFILVFMVVFAFRAWLLKIETPAGLTGEILALVLIGGATVLLYAQSSLSLMTLRSVELTIMAALTFRLAAQTYVQFRGSSQELLAAGQSQPLELALANASATLLPFVWLVMIYAMLIPNRWQRAAWVCLPVALTPLAVRGFLHWQYPELSGLVTLEKVSLALLIVLLGYASAVYGTYVINSLRREAFEARRLGQYQLTEKIGTGGMGEVWRGRHQMLARPAAIKLIRSEMLGTHDPAVSSLLLKRFEREAQATATLSSPHSVVLYDFGITEDDTFYYVMELLDGLDLDTLVERFGPVPPGRVIHFLCQACESLADAHHSGLIHRDIKPANIYTCRLGQTTDFVKVLDFGLVKTQPKQELQSAQLTQVGVATGTPAYMAPEQALGEDIDARADLYALGCVGYFLLTGKLVFEGENPMSTLIDHVKTTPVPPSQVVDAELPADLEQVILRCLEKDPKQRPPSAEELSGLLRQCADATAWGAAEAADWWRLHLGKGGGLDELPGGARQAPPREGMSET